MRFYKMLENCRVATQLVGSRVISTVVLHDWFLVSFLIITGSMMTCVTIPVIIIHVSFLN
jgi:hypothetical protein